MLGHTYTIYYYDNILAWYIYIYIFWICPPRPSARFAPTSRKMTFWWSRVRRLKGPRKNNIQNKKERMEARMRMNVKPNCLSKRINSDLTRWGSRWRLALYAFYMRCLLHKMNYLIELLLGFYSIHCCHVFYDFFVCPI